MKEDKDNLHMGRALELARKGLGDTSPNPAVGCVIVKDGEVVGMGYHQVAGGPHAEVIALGQAGALARGADIYLTLEPCSHHGRTPPCVDALIDAGVSRVVIAMEDPNPEVAGEGIKKLKDAGIKTLLGVGKDHAERLNEGFSLSIVKKRAFVHLKLASTLDGSIATSTGDSRWVSCEESRFLVHHLRQRCAAVMVGAGTASCDDPKLTVRLPGEEEVETLRLIIDKDLTLSTDLWIFGKERAASTVVFASREVDKKRVKVFTETGAKVVLVPPHEVTGLDLEVVLKEVYALGKMEILLEGGSKVAKSFFDAHLIDRLHLFFAPKLLGGVGIPLFAGEGFERMGMATAIDDLETMNVGSDIYITGTPRWEET